MQLSRAVIERILSTTGREVDHEGFRPECATHPFEGRREQALTRARKASGHRQGISTVLLMIVTALAGNIDEARHLAGQCAGFSQR
jgi:hypothetical protein